MNKVHIVLSISRVPIALSEAAAGHRLGHIRKPIDVPIQRIQPISPDFQKPQSRNMCSEVLKWQIADENYDVGRTNEPDP